MNSIIDGGIIDEVLGILDCFQLIQVEAVSNMTAENLIEDVSIIGVFVGIFLAIFAELHSPHIKNSQL
jgi:hypothetical protein